MDYGLTQTIGTWAKSSKGRDSPQRDTDWELLMDSWSAELGRTTELFRPAPLSWRGAGREVPLLSTSYVLSIHELIGFDPLNRPAG